MGSYGGYAGLVCANLPVCHKIQGVIGFQKAMLLFYKIVGIRPDLYCSHGARVCQWPVDHCSREWEQKDVDKA